MNSVCKFGWAELGWHSGKFARPLHRSPALRVVFEQGSGLASVDGGRLRPAHLVVALVEQCEPVISSAVTKLGHDSLEVLRGLSARLIEGFGARQKTPRRKTQDEKVKGRGGRCLNHLQDQEIPYPSRYEPDHHGYRA